QPQARGGGAGRGSGAGTAGRADPGARAEAVVVVGAGFQTCHIGAHAVRVLGEGEGGAAPHDQGEALVEGDLPGDLHALLSQPAVRCERGRGEPGPDEHRAGQRIPGGDPEGEGVLGDPGRVEPGRGEGAARGQVRGEGEGGGRGGDGQEA